MNKNSHLSHHRCNSRYCTTQAVFIDNRIACLGDPGDSIVGWCPSCKKMVCSRCCFKIPIPQEQWELLPDSTEITKICNQNSIKPVALQCKRCGSFLGKCSDIFVWKMIFA